MPDQFAAYPASIGGFSVSTIADPDNADKRQPLGYEGSYEAQESTNALKSRDVPKVMNDFRKGIGYVRHRTADDDGGYAWAESMLMWLGEGPMPAGQVHDYDLTGVTNANSQGTTPIVNGRVVQMIEFLGHLWLIFDKPAIIRIPNADPAQTPTYDPAINFTAGGTYGTAITSLGAGNKGRCAAIFKTTAGAQALYVGTDNGGVGRVYEITGTGNSITGGGATVDFTTGTTYSASKMAVVYWNDKANNTGALRLLLKTAAGEIRHCIDESDPKLQASYVTPIQVSTPADEIQAIVAAPQHAYAITASGFKDFNEFRVRDLDTYWKTTKALTAQTAAVNYGLPAVLWGNYLVASRGFGSIDRYPVTVDGAQQRKPGECGPSAFMQDGTPLSACWNTALCESGDGGLLGAFFNPYNGTSYILRGFVREDVGVPGPGPVIWHGAEVVVPPSGGQNYMATALHVSAPALSAGSVLASPKLYLWMALYPSGGGQTRIKYVELPLGAGPLSIRASGGTAIAHAPAARLYLTGDNGDDANAPKAQRRVDLSHQDVTASNTIAVYQRADGSPSSLTDDSTWTLIGTADGSHPDGTSTNLVPSTVPFGKMIYTHLRSTTGSPYTAPPRLQEIRLRRNIRAEVFDVRILWLIFEHDHPLLNGTYDTEDPDAVFAAIVPFLSQGPITYIDLTTGASFQALVEKIGPYTRRFVNEKGYRTIARVELSLVKAN